VVTAPVRAAAPARRTWTRPPRPVSRVAEAVWARAEAANSAAAWDDAAELYLEERAGCTDDCGDAAYAVVLARTNALAAEHPEPPSTDTPVDLPPRARAVVDAIDDYIEQADAADPELPALSFLAANMLARWNHPDALVRLEAILREYRGDETAEYAANILLDALVRAGRIGEVRALVDELLADEAFLAGKDALRATLERLRAVIAADAP
jgi:pentatricopeptide repeat protein